jgi:hypothetical protein
VCPQPDEADVVGAHDRFSPQIENPGGVAKALSMTTFPRWRARSRSADVVRAPSA